VRVFFKKTSTFQFFLQGAKQQLTNVRFSETSTMSAEVQMSWEQKRHDIKTEAEDTELPAITATPQIQSSNKQIVAATILQSMTSKNFNSADSLSIPLLLVNLMAYLRGGVLLIAHP
jgi:hypothetical protein